MAETPSLLDLLDARSGVVCAVGAGGKKSLLRALAKSHPGRVAITATAFTTYFQEHMGFAVAVDTDERLPDVVAALDPRANVAYACPGTKPGRRAGVSPATIERIHREGRFDATYVKADGARMRLIKAPAETEPAIPAAATVVLPLVSAHAIGEPLAPNIAHRVEQIAQVTQADIGAPIRPEHVGRLLSSPDGLLKGTAGRRVVPVINMVDDATLEAHAREAAAVALARTDRFDRVVLVTLARLDDPLVAVVTRATG